MGGRKIAFFSNRDGNNEIYVMDTDGGNLRNLTNSPASDDCPNWSPDSQWIAFSSNRDGNEEIYIMDADGDNLRKLTNNDAFDAAPDWFAPPAHLVFPADRSITLWGWLKAEKLK